ncbi:MAG TPA: RluA family pseudouridine synthase [Steroidobacteraceae bacterium]|nr:RluA family pseudouridine synthase [Steroidobacteraceae bacterium]
MRKTPAAARRMSSVQPKSSAPREPEHIGVRHVVAGEGDAGQRIDNFLLRHLKNLPRSRVYRILRTGQVRVNGKRIGPDFKLSDGDQVRIPPVRLEPKAEAAAPSRSLRDYIDKAILYEDRDLLVVNKPAGIAVHGGSGLSFGVIEALRAMRPELDELELVHRLDRETSGCLIVAKRRAALRELHALLREREMEKTYLALLCGRWPFGNKTLDLPLKTNLKQGGERVVKVHADGQQAISTFTPIKHFGKLATLVEVSIGTGRTHQIRVHAAHAGYPIVGDEKYGDREREAPFKALGLNRMFLHALRLRFQRRGTPDPFEIEAPLPAELQDVLEALKRQK